MKKDKGDEDSQLTTGVYGFTKKLDALNYWCLSVSSPSPPWVSMVSQEVLPWQPTEEERGRFLKEEMKRILNI